MGIDIKKVLFCYDGSECADAALEDLRAAGLPATAEALVLSVAEQLPMVPPGYMMMPELAGSGTALFDAARAQAERAAERVKSYFPGWQMQVETLGGSPSTEIINRADEWQPDLIVLGSHGRSTLGRVFFGSVSQNVAVNAHCSVRVSRPQPHADNNTRLLIAIDGSSAAAAAVHAVGKRNWPAGTSVLLVTSSASPDMLDVSVDARIQTPEEVERSFRVAKHFHEVYSKELAQASLLVSSFIGSGDPKQVIIEEAEKWQADTIFVGSRGFGRIKRLLLGSVSSAVVARARCSVEIVRA